MRTASDVDKALASCALGETRGKMVWDEFSPDNHQTYAALISSDTHLANVTLEMSFPLSALSDSKSNFCAGDLTGDVRAK